MQGAARLFFTSAIIYAVIGMLLGLKMGLSQDHGQMPTHAHIMLAGLVFSALFAYFYHLFPAINSRGIATFHFWFQTAVTIVMLGSLYLVYDGNAALEPVLGIASMGFALGVLLFAYIALPAVWRGPGQTAE